jgi:uncharacterized protein involved in exopolysaccharide biosynthesis
MTTVDAGAEREVDLARWRAALAARWWIPLAGLVLGAIAGWVLALGGAQVYTATALLSLGQPFSPNGNAPVQSYATNPRAVSEIVHSEFAVKQAARAAGIGPGAVRGNVSTGTVGAATGTGAARAGSPLVTITVQLHKPKRAEAAANELAKIVVEQTTSKYVGTKIATFSSELASVHTQLTSIQQRISDLNAAIRTQGLSALDKLVLVSQIDNAEQRSGQLLDQQALAQQQLALARNVESAQIIQPAAAVKSTARSRRNSILVGALIGLILGSVAAIVVDARAASPRAA